VRSSTTCQRRIGSRMGEGRRITRWLSESPSMRVSKSWHPSILKRVSANVEVTRSVWLLLTSVYNVARSASLDEWYIGKSLPDTNIRRFGHLVRFHMRTLSVDTVKYINCQNLSIVFVGEKASFDEVFPIPKLHVRLKIIATEIRKKSQNDIKWYPYAWLLSSGPWLQSCLQISWG
jgi:hypothetical protein